MRVESKAANEKLEIRDKEKSGLARNWEDEKRNMEKRMAHLIRTVETYKSDPSNNPETINQYKRKINEYKNKVKLANQKIAAIGQKLGFQSVPKHQNGEPAKIPPGETMNEMHREIKEMIEEYRQPLE